MLARIARSLVLLTAMPSASWAATWFRRLTADTTGTARLLAVARTLQLDASGTAVRSLLLQVTAFAAPGGQSEAHVFGYAALDIDTATGLSVVNGDRRGDIQLHSQTSANGAAVIGGPASRQLDFDVGLLLQRSRLRIFRGRRHEHGLRGGSYRSGPLPGAAVPFVTGLVALGLLQ